MSTAGAAPTITAQRDRIAQLLSTNRAAEALAACDEAIARDPGIIGFHIFRVLCLFHLERYAELDVAAAHPVLRMPMQPTVLWLRARALWKLGRETEAIAPLEQAVALNPGDAGMRELLGRYRLTLGQFDAGWPEYEYRLARLPAVRADVPRWAGDDPAGKRLLVVSEQGLGDTIQFARYLPMLLQAGAQPTILIQPALRQLLAAAFPTAEWIVDKRAPGTFDRRIDLLSLPLIFGTRSDTVPHTVPYLVPDRAKAGRWKAIIGDKGFRVGVVWQGSTGPMRDDARSLPIDLLASLGRVPGVRLISLQGITGLNVLAHLPPGITIERLGADIEGNPDGIAEVAAAMQSVHLIVSSDTMAAHLAGALARPVWVGLKRDADWRWLRGRDDSPWYPTMRLFRQQRDGDWTSVTAAITAELQNMKEKHTYFG